MAAASVRFSSLCATRPITSTRSSSRVHIAVLFNKTSLAGGLSLRGHFYSVREGTLSKSFNSPEGAKEHLSADRSLLRRCENSCSAEPLLLTSTSHASHCRSISEPSLAIVARNGAAAKL